MFLKTVIPQTSRKSECINFPQRTGNFSHSEFLIPKLFRITSCSGIYLHYFGKKVETRTFTEGKKKKRDGNLQFGILVFLSDMQPRPHIGLFKTASVMCPQILGSNLASFLPLEPFLYLPFSRRFLHSRNLWRNELKTNFQGFLELLIKVLKWTRNRLSAVRVEWTHPISVYIFRRTWCNYSIRVWEVGIGI